MIIVEKLQTFLILALIILSITSLLYYIYYKTYNKKKLIQSRLIPNSRNIAGEGGIIFVFLFLFFYWYLSTSKLVFGNINLQVIPRFYIFFISVVALSILSYIDDKFDLSKKIRFIFQIIICFASLSALNLPLVDQLPLKLEFIIIIFIWVYIINTTNFIDGLNGVVGSNGVTFFFGSLIIINHYGIDDNFFILINFLTLILVSSFLIFNYPKAYIFFGDTGSIPLGYIIGYVTFYFFSLDIFYPLIFIFTYPLVDVSITLFDKTFIRKKLPWARLFDYYFLMPVINGKKSHSFVTNKIILNNIINILFLILFLNYQENKLLLFLPILSSICLVYYFRKYKKVKS